MENKYFEDDLITCYRSDLNQVMRPDAFLDMAQQIAVMGAEHLDFGRRKMLEYGCAWVIARMHVKFEQKVYFDEKIRLSTWHKGMNGLYFIRDYRLEGPSGVAVNSTSSWIVMNLQSRKICRDDEIMQIIPAGSQCSDSAIEANAPRITFPKNATPEELGAHTVNYSDIDYNGHVNNVKYTVWALDSLPRELVCGHFLRELSINFNKEARLGDSVMLLHTETDGAHIVEGRCADHQVFIERFVFDATPMDGAWHI